MRKTAIALSGVAVAGVLSLVTWKMARSRPSEPSAGFGLWHPAPGDGGAQAAASTDGGWTPPKFDTYEDPHWKSGVPMRPMDRDIIAALQSGTIARTSMADIFPDRPYKVRFAGSPETQSFAFVLVDLNRDDKWDEKWDLRQPGTIKRTVFHDPGAQEGQVWFTLVKGRWQPH